MGAEGVAHNAAGAEDRDPWINFFYISNIWVLCVTLSVSLFVGEYVTSSGRMDQSINLLKYTQQTCMHQYE